MTDLTIREINMYLKKSVNLPLHIKKNKIKAFLLKKYFNQNWNKAGCKTHYNFYVINEYLDLPIEYIIKNASTNKKKCFIVIDYLIEIPIRLQDVFHFKFVNEIKNYKLTNEWFDENGFLDEDIINIEQRVSCCNDKIYRTDMEIQVCDNHYICIEFFENKHNNFDDIDLQREKNRIYNLLHENNNDKKYLHFAIFWESKLNDKKYFEKFVKEIVKKIRDYKNINNKKIWCINSINSFIKHEKLSEQLYNGYTNKNKPLIKLSDLETLIQWKMGHFLFKE